MINENFPDFKKLPNKKHPNFTYQHVSANNVYPEVSIITPFYETGEVFLETIESLLNQSFQNFEWLIINDGSKRGQSIALLEAVTARDKRVRVISHSQNKGLPGARNTGIENAKAGFLYFLDSDDLIEPTLIEKFYLFLINNPSYDFVNSWSLGFNASEYFWKENVLNPKKILDENTLLSAYMGRREMFLNLRYDEKIRNGLEDWDFWLKVFSEGKKGYTIPEFLFWYRRTDNTKRWLNLGNNEENKKIRNQLRAKYSHYIQNIPEQSSDLNRDFKIGKIGNKKLPLNILKKTKKRILFIVPWIELGGADKYNLDVIKGLTNKWEFSIITTLKSANPWEPIFTDVTPDIFHLPHLSPTSAFHSSLDYFIETRNPDLILLSNSMYGYWVLPYLKNKYPTIPIVDYVHCEDPGWMDGGYPRMSAVTYNFIDRTLVSSTHLKEYITDIQKSAVNKIDICYTNIDTNEVKKDYSIRERKRLEWKVQDNFPIILYAARINGQKQPFVMVNAIKELYKKTTNFLLIVLGDGPDLEQMRKLILEYGLENKIWCMGAVNNEEVKEYMDVADIFFLPSLYEGIALSIYESMAKELAIVGADVGGQKELVTTECGYLITRSDPETEAREYASKLFHLVKDADLRKRMGANGRKRVERYFKIETMHKQLNEVFNEVLAQKKADNRNVSSDSNADIYLSLLYKYMKEEELANSLWARISSQTQITETHTIIESDNGSILYELTWHKEEVNKIKAWYEKEYEVLPKWYKQAGHLIKIIKGKRSFKSLLSKNK